MSETKSSCERAARYATAPHLATERLLLEPPVARDLEESVRLWGNAETMAFIGDGRPLNIEDVWSRLLRQVGGWEWFGFGYWTVRRRSDRRYVGTVGFQNLKRLITPGPGDAPEIGWLLTPDMQGQGFAREAVAGALSWADAHLAAPETACIIRPTHERSIRIAVASGYRRTGSALYHATTIDLFFRPRGGAAGNTAP